MAVLQEKGMVKSMLLWSTIVATKYLGNVSFIVSEIQIKVDFTSHSFECASPKSY